MTPKMLTAVTLSLGMLVAVHAQQPGAAATALPALDYYEIQQLYARFVHTLDTAEDGGNAFANVFTADGVFIDAGGKRYDGHDQLAAFAREDPDGRKGPTNVAHYVTNIAVDATPPGARGHGYLLTVTTAPPAPAAAGGRGRGAVRAVTDGGQYWDDLVRTPAGWRIRMRTLVRPNGSVPPAAPALTTATAAAVPSMPHPLTAQDYADIDQLFALFGYGFDSAADQGYAWANLFTPDGIFVNGTVVGQMKGRDINAAFAYGSLTFGGGFASLTRGPVPAKNPLGIQHILTDLMVEPVADGAVVTLYRLAATIGADGRPALAPGGIYHALLARTSEGWRFKENWFVGAGAALPDGATRFMPKRGDPPAASPRPATMPALTVAAEDDAEIRQLYARFSHAMDSAADNGRALAQLFTPDGVFLDTWTNKVYAGPEQLAALARGTAADGKGPANMNQFIWTVKIEAAPQGAVAKAYMVTGKLQAPGQPIVMTNGGQYWDDLVKTPAGWRFRKRAFFRTSQTPPS